jgi:hypothetical protein
MSALGGGFNRSTQHLLIVSDWEVNVRFQRNIYRRVSNLIGR